MRITNKTNLFLLLTFGISFTAAGLFYLLGGKLSSTGGLILATSYMFTPMISVLIVEKLIYKEDIGKKLFISFKINKWFLVAWLITPVIVFGTIAISLLLPGVSYSPGMEGMFARYEEILTPEEIDQMRISIDMIPFHPVWMSLISGLIAGLTINAVAGFGEELGWRGFLIQQFRNMSFMKASLLTGIIWGFWHAPLILMGHNYPQFPVAGVFMMTLWCVLLSPLFLYITIKSGSVIAAAVMHGTLNGTAGLSIMLIEGGNELTVGATGLAGFISLIIVTAGLFIYDNIISREKIMNHKISQYL